MAMLIIAHASRTNSRKDPETAVDRLSIWKERGWSPAGTRGSVLEGGAEVSLRRAVEAAVGSPISCMTSDAFLWLVGDLAEERGLPWVAIRTGGCRSALAFAETDLILSTFGTGTGTCIMLILFGNRNSPFPRMLHSMGNTLHRATAVAVNCFEEAEPVVTKYLGSKIPKYLSIGPLGLASPPPFSDPNGCIPWLDHREPSPSQMS
ncbi:hypothetical protein CRG98_000023 [Punica granatum]|uniref:Uncharacterized protein n=1 Tax=Punica granatum TaxID=22663 RepID=A0A2I0LFT2_PUNGR|nr:hypothetical protein CRG98_000023 [Punica granatum]